MTDHQPRYRFRGSVEPSAAVKRPVIAHRGARAEADGTTKPDAPTVATIDIFDVIDSYGGWWGISASEVDAAIKQVGDVDTLYVRLNSPGGEATEGVAISNLLRAHKAEVRVTVYGLAASAASMVAVGGDTVNMAPGSILMIHDALNILYGNADELRKEAGVLDTISDSYAGIYAAKAGGTTAEWRTVMRADRWYSAEEAVAAKLADTVGLDPTMPDNLPAVETDADDADDAQVIQIDVNVNPAARAAAKRFDLSMLPNAAAALAPTEAPADQPVTPPTTPKEADTMSDTIPTAGLTKALGLADDADEDTILEAVEAKITAASASAANPTDPAIPDGKVLVSENVLAELKTMAQAGAQARAKQLADERDETIAQAFAEGKISADRKAAWATSWDKDPEGTKADLESLPARFPVAAAPGIAGGESITPGQYTDEMADEDAAFFGVSKEALTR